MSEISDETLMAYADKTLSGAELARVEAAIAGDKAIGRRAAAFTATTPGTIAPLFAPIAAQSVPERLIRTIENATPRTSKSAAMAGPLGSIIAFFQGFLPDGTPPATAAMAFAASVAAIAYGGAWVGGRVPASDPFGTTLETARSNSPIRFSGAEGTRTLTPVLTFASKDDLWCRLYTLEHGNRTRRAGIACREGSRSWRIVAEADIGKGTLSRHAVANAAAGALDPRLRDMIKGNTFGPGEENALLKSGWRRTQ